VRPDTNGGGSTRKHRTGKCLAAGRGDASVEPARGTLLQGRLRALAVVRNASVLSLCCVGVGFFKSREGELLLTSVAQVFDERREGVVVQGGNARIDKLDRSPHLNADDAERLVRRQRDALQHSTV
jgi:hypothetical protein